MVNNESILILKSKHILVLLQPKIIITHDIPAHQSQILGNPRLHCTSVVQSSTLSPADIYADRASTHLGRITTNILVYNEVNVYIIWIWIFVGVAKIQN